MRQAVLVLKKTPNYNIKIMERNEQQAKAQARAKEVFDSIANNTMHISGDEFIRRWNGGEFNDPSHPQLNAALLVVRYLHLTDWPPSPESPPKPHRRPLRRIW
jgi:hypothetical protein